AASGVKRIRIHGIRHSHISLLIDMGFSAVAIADRVGHESIDITYRYAHVFQSTQMEVVSKLNNIMTIRSFQRLQTYGVLLYFYLR
ncbi:MAG: tyrosine-type recombinase/integrase, partial [Clostridia bacterium]|nr:tyrosine-type recombinase/integrase [Clostridia bacterium]